jgi:UrcA family protein
MTKKFRRLCGMLLVLNGGIFCAGAAWAASRETEEVTVDSPYTVRQKTLTRSLTGEMLTAQVSVESNVSYADLDLSKGADRATMRERLRQAAVDNCRELERRSRRSINVTLDASNCVSRAINQSLARLDEISNLRRQVASAP